MSAMPATHGHSAACCNVPPVVEEGYKEKGTYEEIATFKTYTIGSPTSKKGLLVIYDIFGYFPQTLQGADILASASYLILVPDWFRGSPADIKIFPPDTPEKQKTLSDFLSLNHPAKAAPQIPGFIAAAKARYPDVTEWGIVGFCWGGKVVSQVTQEGTVFKAAAQVHPAMVDAVDAEKATIPIALLASKDEDAEQVKKCEKVLPKGSYVETYGDQIHGWMAARSNLKDPRNKEEYARGYKKLLEFFGEHL